MCDTSSDLILDVLKILTKPFDDVFREAYRQAGFPYGDTEEGYTRWLNELEQMIPDYRRNGR